MEKKIHPSSAFCEYNHINESVIARFFGALHKFKGKLTCRSALRLFEYVAVVNKIQKVDFIQKIQTVSVFSTQLQLE